MAATTINTLPQEHSSKLIENMIGESFIMSHADLQIGSTLGNTFVVDNDDTLGAFQVARDDLKEETEEETSLKPVPSTTIFKRIVIPNQSLEDDLVLYNAIVQRTAKKLAVTLDAAIAGIISPMPAGFDTLAEATEITVDDVDSLIDADTALAEIGFAPTSYWLSPEGRSAFMKMKKADGNPVFANYTESGLGTIFGLQAFVNRWVGDVLGYSGDWSQVIVPMSKDVRIRSNPYSDRAFQHNSTEFLVEMDVGCGIANPAAINKMVAPAA